MRPEELVNRIPSAHLAGPPFEAVQGVSHDSRDVKPGDLFACLVGEKFDGHQYAGDAIARGAAALLAQSDHADSLPAGVPAILVPNTRRALPDAASAVYDDPSRSLKMVGVTGTNGKTTSTNLIASILNHAGITAGTIGTLGAELKGEDLPSEHTTPEADQLQALLAEMRRRGAQAVVMEVSSHALAQYRTDGTWYDAAVFTNLTQDHLDYHKTMDAYFAAKLRLFTDYPAAGGKPFAASINIDDEYGRRLALVSRGRVLTYAVNSAADIRATDVRLDAGRSAFRVETPEGGFDAELHIGGAFQVYNALGAIGAALGLGISLDEIARGLAALSAVPGRFESVPTGRGFHVIVDYAHTPDGLDNLLTSARRLNPRRIITVFGCGGNRDSKKRPIMGRIVAKGADVAIVTSDNPRNEDPQAIIDDILPGMGGASARVLVEPDRRTAIAAAIGEARDGDIVLIAGKGHEDYQIIGDEKFPFDDRQVAREVLERLGANG
jgi:UDP-N-acetylmuramoyl-L-alanyl-D-glutamate--2,6-diaminopimelate ligase